MFTFKVGLDSFIAGFIAYPIVSYCIRKFGAVLFQDTKKTAYAVWDNTKSTAASIVARPNA